MQIIKYNQEGWVCYRYPYNLSDEVQELEVDDDEFSKTLSSNEFYQWRVVDGKLELQKYEEKVWTQEERLQERMELHKVTDQDFAKYSRQVRLKIDMPHSQEVLDYIDSYNLQVSNTVNEVGFPQNVTYPEYNLP